MYIIYINIYIYFKELLKCEKKTKALQTFPERRERRGFLETVS